MDKYLDWKIKNSYSVTPISNNFATKLQIIILLVKPKLIL